jgi:hypothetical protein
VSDGTNTRTDPVEPRSELNYGAWLPWLTSVSKANTTSTLTHTDTGTDSNVDPDTFVDACTDSVDCDVILVILRLQTTSVSPDSLSLSQDGVTFCNPSKVVCLQLQNFVCNVRENVWNFGYLDYCVEYFLRICCIIKTYQV